MPKTMTMPSPTSRSNRKVIESFEEFREELDEHNDRRERLIKVSLILNINGPLNKIPSSLKAGRDVTNLSKKAIFLLHRIVNEDSEDDQALALRAAQRGREKLLEVQRIYATLRDELAGDRFWRYQRSVSSGVQEYIEALSFAHYLEYKTLVTFDQVQRSLSDENGVPVRIYALHITCTPRVIWFRSIVFSFADLGLSAGSLGFDWRTHALYNIRAQSQRRALKGQRCMRLCQRMQGRQEVPPLLFIPKLPKPYRFRAANAVHPRVIQETSSNRGVS
jgi:predicted translin family RNA/ssDNA-binding protein